MKHLLTITVFLLHYTVHAQQKIQHTATAANTSANSTYMDAAGLNGNPNAIIIVEYDAATAKANPHAVGVWYNGNKWAIFNQDRATMPVGLLFSITWFNANDNNFFQKASPNNLSNGRMLIEHPLLNNNPAANFYASQVWNPGGIGGVYNNAEMAVSYDAAMGKWVISNVNGTPVPDGASFNIAVQANTKNGYTKIDPGVKKNPANTNPTPVFNNETVRNAGTVIDPTVLQAVSAGTANLGFEELFLNWKATGTAFANQPISGNTVMSDRVTTRMNYASGGIGGDYWKGIPYPIGFKGNNWIGTYENGNGDAPVGTLTSKPIRAEKRYLCFLLGGGKDFNNLYVELQVKKSDYEAAWGTGKRGIWGETEDGFYRVNRVTSLLNTEDLYRYYFDLNDDLKNQFAGKTIRIQITDNKTGNWGHINADDFIFKDNLDEFIYVMKDGFGVYADKDKPVWGFADTHAHWVNHVDMKGFMWGNPGGKLETSDVLRDIPACDGYNHGLPAPTPGLLLAIVENKAFNRLPERLANVGNAACAALALPCIPAAAAGAGVGATFGSIGQGASGAYAKTGALDGTITGALYGMASCVPFQACGHQFVKDVFAKHYGNNVPENNTAVSNYVDFPAWNSFAHQTMHISWVRRSYDGGQRLMVVPVGVAKSWEFNTTADGNMQPAITHIRNAVAALKELVRLNDGWMKIAYTPAEAKKIILENKMAIIIGVEQAEIGSYYPSAQQEVNELYNLGIRHFFPIHNIDNTLGGAAVFNSALNSYNDLVNRGRNNGDLTCLNVKEGISNYDETRVNVKLERGIMRQEMRFVPIVGFGNIPFFYKNDVPARYNYESFISHKNANGLTAAGYTYIYELMKKGVIIDIDHMSDDAQNMAVREMKRNNYPLLSGHTNFRDLRREGTETEGDGREARLKTEFTIYNSRAIEIINSGGMFGLMNQQNNVNNAPGCTIPNTSAGGTSSFIQAYWYALQKGGEEHGIAFGSDANGFAPQVAPRFGTDAVYFLEGDKGLNPQLGDWDKDTRRRRFAFQQTNGVRYDKPITTWHYHRFQPTGFLTQEERDIWEALAMAKSGTDINNAWQPGGGLNFPERTDIQRDKIKNIAYGFRWGILREPTGDYGAYLECPEYIVRDENLNNCMPERKAAYLCIRGENSLPEHMKSSRTIELYRIMKRIYDLWMQFENGPNEPLRRSFAGTRDFDFNLDGQAHYGMLPDLIQDMKNHGLSAAQMKPLFLGANQFISLWEKAEAAKNNIQK
ncbi:MAG: membrane dipeptidase [Bacteroidetes bacterium]|nr:membrane dipeptidase [Bacteroidota bacterium]